PRSDTAELDDLGCVDAVKLIDAQAEFSAETHVGEGRENGFEMRLVFVPDGVGHDLVEAIAQFDGTPTDRVDEIGIEERFAARQTEGADTLTPSVFEKAQRDGDVEVIGPLDGNAAMRTGEVTLICSCEGEIIGPKDVPPRRWPTDTVALAGRLWRRHDNGS